MRHRVVNHKQREKIDAVADRGAVPVGRLHIIGGLADEGDFPNLDTDTLPVFRCTNARTLLLPLL